MKSMFYIKGLITDDNYLFAFYLCELSDIKRIN